VRTQWCVYDKDLALLLLRQRDLSGSSCFVAGTTFSPESVRGEDSAVLHSRTHYYVEFQV
jgi:hypothetical protein